MKLEEINAFACICGYFYSAFIQEGILINSGHNCSHPDQKEVHIEKGKKIGCCYEWSCPFTQIERSV